MHGTPRFQSSGFGADAAATSSTSSTKTGLTDAQFSSIISGITDIGKTAIETVGDIETARVTGRSSSKTPSVAPLSSRAVSGGAASGGTGISGTALAVGGLLLLGLGVGGYFFFKRR